MGDASLVQQLEDVLKTTALSAMAVFEQGGPCDNSTRCNGAASIAYNRFVYQPGTVINAGIHQTQEQLQSCLGDLHRVREAADSQCMAQVQQIQLQYQQDLDALTAQYEGQVRP